MSNQNELNEKVAALQGWTFKPQKDYVVMIDPRGKPRMRYYPRRTAPDKRDRFFLAGIPDYCNDLNACHELIDFLAGKGWVCRLDNGLDKTWECTFYRPDPRSPQEEHYRGADTLCMAIVTAFIAAMARNDVDRRDSSGARKQEQILEER